VVRRIAPGVEIVDITHGIAPQHILQGALVLAETLPYMPIGVHVAVVDPGVGGERRPIAIRGRDGRLYVGPDNGLLLVAADRLGTVEAVVELTRSEFMLEPVSPTFHGRDVFSPVAGHLASGVPFESLGDPLESDDLVRLDLPRALIEQGLIQATVLAVDRYGNVRLNIDGGSLARVGIAGGDRVEVEVAGRRYLALAARTFADAVPGEIILYEDSSGSLAIAINRGSAVRMFTAVLGQEITIRA
jgi:S-adenosyl-L-methionine hydrolase (adenosine-forming)